MLAVILVLDFCNIYSILIQLNLVYTLEESDKSLPILLINLGQHTSDTSGGMAINFCFYFTKSPKLVSLCKLDQSLPSCTISKWLYCNVLDNHSMVFAATSQPYIFICEKFHLDHDSEVVMKRIHHMSVTCISFGSQL